MNVEQRTFVDGLMTLIDKRPVVYTDAAAESAFRTHIMERWDQLVFRLAGAASWEARQMDANQLAQLRVLEDHPSLLAPLGRTHDELSHTTLIAWVLGHDSAVGVTARRTFAQALGVEVPLGGWQVTSEKVLRSGRRVDVVIDVPGQWLSYIEAKVDAQEGHNQLPDYAASLAAMGADREHPPSLVFLTKDGGRGDRRAKATPMSFRDLLVLWLPVAANETGDAATYLSCWLVTLAEDIYELSEPGPFHTWGFSSQRRTLDLLREIKEAR